MRRILTLLLLTVMALLAGCASVDYQAYVAAHETSQTSRNRALLEIAKSGDSTAKVAAVMALQFGAQSGLQAPRDPWDRALQALGILAPVTVQAYSINKQTQLGVIQSNNALATRRDDNATMLGFGTLINSPTVVTQPAPIVITAPDPVIVRPEVIQVPVIQPAP